MTFEERLDRAGLRLPPGLTVNAIESVLLQLLHHDLVQDHLGATSGPDRSERVRPPCKPQARRRR